MILCAWVDVASELIVIIVELFLSLISRMKYILCDDDSEIILTI